MMGLNDRLEIEAEFHPDIFAFLPKKLPLSGKPVVGNDADAEIVTGVRGKCNAQLGGGTQAPLGGCFAIHEQASDRTSLPGKYPSGTPVIVNSDGGTGRR